MTHLVYKLTNTVNGKSYVGITSRSLADRWSEHQKRSREGLRNSRLHMAMRKYGHEVFTREVLAIAETEQEVRALECRYIREFDTMNSGYNCNEGGAGILHFSPEIRRKIGDAQRGKVNSPDARAKMSAAKIGDKKMALHFGEHTKKGAENPRATWFAVSCPDGVLRIERGLRAFIRKHNLIWRHLQTRGHSKGFYLLDRFTNAVPSANVLI
jgi:group I intron endonuclease